MYHQVYYQPGNAYMPPLREADLDDSLENDEEFVDLGKNLASEELTEFTCERIIT